MENGMWDIMKEIMCIDSVFMGGLSTLGAIIPFETKLAI